MAGDTGILNQAQFFEFQKAEDEFVVKEWGKGMDFSAEESGVIYEAMNCVSPEYDGVKADDMAKFRKVRDVVVAAWKAAAAEGQ